MEVQSKLEVLDDRLVALESLAAEPSPASGPSTGAGPSGVSKHNRDRLEALEDRLRALEMQVVEQAATSNSLFNTVVGRLNSLEIIITSFFEAAGRLLHLLRSRERAPGE